MAWNNLLLSDLPGGDQAPALLQHLHMDTLILSGVAMTFILATGSVIANSMVVEGAGGTGQAIVEGIYNTWDQLTHDYIGEDYKKFFPLIMSIFIFVLIANFMGVFPFQAISHNIPQAWPMVHSGHEPEAWEWASPTTDINVTAGLALVVLFTYIGSGVLKHGGRYAKMFFFSPTFWVEWLDAVIRPATLALRLMIVISADEILRGAFLVMCPILMPAGIMGFELFIGVIQALVFALLTSVYIGLTVQEHH